MNKEYVLHGLTCANCASKIENTLKHTHGIRMVSVNVMNATLQVTFLPEEVEQIDTVVKNVVHTFEPDIVIQDKKEQTNNQHDHQDFKKTILFLGIGTFLFLLGIVLSHITELDTYLTLTIFFISYVILGGSVIRKAIKNILRGQVFDENFLMGIATIGAFVIGDFAEGVAVMLFYQIGEFFQDMAVRRSKQSITKLMDIRPDYANLKIGDITKKVSPEEIVIGDIIVVKPGEKVPLDGVVVEGKSMLDTMALTGESVPRKVEINDAVLSGCVNQNGLLSISVTKTFGDSTVAKIIDLVENAGSKKAPTENFITTFSRYYTPVVVILAMLLAIIPPLFIGGAWSEWMHRGLIFLVISCPCALVVSIPLGFFGGIGGASKKGVLIKGGNYLEALNALDTIVFDKTGTLTEGVFEVVSIFPANGFDEASVLQLAAKVEVFSNHPIALSIQKAYAKEVDKKEVTKYQELAGYGISAVVNKKQVYAGNDKLMQLQDISYMPNNDVGTKLYLAMNDVYAGCIIISDKIKEDSHRAILELKKKGIQKIVMLTGGNKATAKAISRELALDEVYAELLPDQKVEKVEKLDANKGKGGKLAFVGDGINDAPVLARADIGIAMGAMGSDAAIEAADIVLMTDEPSKLIEAIDIARFTKRIVWQNIIFALGVKIIFLVFGAFGYTTMWEAVFADVGVSVLAIFNAMRVIKIK